MRGGRQPFAKQANGSGQAYPWRFTLLFLSVVAAQQQTTQNDK